MHEIKEKILSVSIAAYNVQEYIGNTLDSLICEDVMDKLEVLIIDDGSHDNTVNIVNQYVAKYPDTFKLISKENGGWGSTVNKGMELANGKYFKLLDGDDWFFTENLSEFIDFLSSVDTDIILSAFGMYDDSLGRVYADKKMPFDQNKDYNFDEVAELYDIQMHGFAVNKKIIEKAKIQILKGCFYTDTQFVTELFANAKSMRYFEKNVYCYRIGRNGQSISAEGLLKHLGDNLKVTQELLDYKEKVCMSSGILKAYDKKINYTISMELYSCCFLSYCDRKGRYNDILNYIKKEGIEFRPVSKEVELNIRTKFVASKAIHIIFEITRKAARFLHLDLLQRAR